MATNTYVALDKVTVGSAVASVTFSSIPSGYTDLVIVGNFGTTSGGANIALQVGNGSIDTGSNYSFTYLRGDGSSAGSGRASNQAQIYIDYSAYASSSIAATYIWQVQNYSNATTYKTVLGRANTASVGTNATVGLWRSTSAINTIKLDTQSTTFLSGSTFSLYGIAASGVTPAAKATGGAIYSDDTYYYHVFGSTGTFTPLQSITADIVAVAGGGSNGTSYGSGGGAGGLLGLTGQSLTATNYTVTIGAGGSAVGSSSSGNNGSNSQFGALTAAVGGGGGGGNFGSAAGNGGSGGGGSFGNAGGTGVSGQGFAGGTASSPGVAGGGGAGAVGGNGVSAGGSGSGGGIGSSVYSSWCAVTGLGELSSGTYYLAGGGGSNNAGGTSGYGGLGGGGGANKASYNGVANTGGGAGHAGDNVGRNGGSGVVIVRYAK